MAIIHSLNQPSNHYENIHTLVFYHLHNLDIPADSSQAHLIESGLIC